MRTEFIKNFRSSAPRWGAFAAVALTFAGIATGIAQPNLRGFSNGSVGFSITPSTANFTDEIEVSFSVENNGTTASTLSWVRLYVSADSVIDPQTDVIFPFATVRVDPIAAGQHAEFTKSVWLPPWSKLDDYGLSHVFMVVDADDDVSESNESDNYNRGNGIDKGTMTINRTPGVDLAVFDGRESSDSQLHDHYFEVADTTVYWGREVLVKWSLINQGLGTITEDFEIDIYLAQNSSSAPGSVLETVSITENNIGTGGIKTGETWVDLPAVSPWGSTQAGIIGIWVDSENQVSEYNEENNGHDPYHDLTRGNVAGYAILTFEIPAPDIHTTNSGGGSTVDFGPVVNDGAGNARETRTVSISNLGPEHLTVSDIRTSGAPFSVVQVVSTAQAIVVPYSGNPIRYEEEETWVVTVEFDPVADGVATGDLIIDSDDPDEPTVTISLTGNGTPIPDLRITDSVDPATDREAHFGTVINDGANGIFATETVSLTNAGTGPLSIQMIQLLDGTVDFTLESVVSSLSGTIEFPAAQFREPDLDADGDGMDDDWETANGLDPENPGDWQWDDDGDYLNNLQEYWNQTAPVTPLSSVTAYEVVVTDIAHNSSVSDHATAGIAVHGPFAGDVRIWNGRVGSSILTPPAGREYHEIRINNLGQLVVREGDAGGASHLTDQIWFWENGEAFMLPELDSGAAISVAEIALEGGTVAGNWQPEGSTAFHSFLWHGGAMKDLGPKNVWPMMQSIVGARIPVNRQGIVIANPLREVYRHAQDDWVTFPPLHQPQKINRHGDVLGEIDASGNPDTFFLWDGAVDGSGVAIVEDTGIPAQDALARVMDDGSVVAAVYDQGADKTISYRFLDGTLNVLFESPGIEVDDIGANFGDPAGADGAFISKSEAGGNPQIVGPGYQLDLPESIPNEGNMTDNDISWYRVRKSGVAQGLMTQHFTDGSSLDVLALGMPAVPDADFDGFPDDWETYWGFDPSNSAEPGAGTSLTLENSGHLIGTIAPSGAEEWEITLRFDPTLAAQLDDTLLIVSDDPAEKSATVTLRGIGQTPGNLDLSNSDDFTGPASLDFGGVHADGDNPANGQAGTANLYFRNSGQAGLTITLDDFGLGAGSAYQVVSITSNLHGVIDFENETSATLVGDGEEIWTVEIEFDPSAAGADPATLTVTSDDPDEPSIPVDLTGTGLDEADLVLLDGDTNPKPQPYAVSSGYVLNDGAGGRDRIHIVLLRNIGTQPLTVPANGIVLDDGAQAYQVTSIDSSTEGAVDLSAASSVIDPVSAETWTVTLQFDPVANLAYADSLEIDSDDPDEAQVSVAFFGEGDQPEILSVLDGVIEQNINAGDVFEVTWEDRYAAGNARVELFYDTDTDPGSGLVSIAANLSEDDDADVYFWLPDAALAGTTVYLYATATDGSITDGAYSAVPLHIDAEGAFQLTSAGKVTSADYAYEYTYLGQAYVGVTTLQLGANTVAIQTDLGGGQSVTHLIRVELLTSLRDQSGITYDNLHRIKTVADGNGVTTTMHYDPLGRLFKTEATNGRAVEWDFDPAGRRTRMQDYTGTTFYDWDELDRLIRVSYSLDEVEGNADDLDLLYSEYDLAGRVKEMILPSGEKIRYIYDDAGRLKEVAVPDHGLVWIYDYDYQRGGLMDLLTHPNGVTSDYGYDDFGRLTSIRHARSDGTLIAEYLYGPLNDLGFVTDFLTNLDGGAQRKEKYEYDENNRISKAIYSLDDGVIEEGADRTVTYTYNDNGNRLTQITEEDGVVVSDRSFQYGTGGRLLVVQDSVSGETEKYQYDGAGNRVRETGDSGNVELIYDDRNVLEKTVAAGVEVIRWSNGDKTLVRKQAGAEDIRYVVNPLPRFDRVVEAVDVNSGYGESILYGIGALGKLFEDPAKPDVFFLGDRQNSVRITLDAAANVIRTRNYDVFGGSLED